ncbi:MAG: 4-alpha-glucanotransferase [Sphaerochaetaceae bacterium]
MENIKYSGILLHPTSLPGNNGIGELGKESYRFVDFLAETHTKFWQTLPLGPTGYGDSPYAPRSTFAGNELLISLDLLIEQSFISEKDLNNKPIFNKGKINFGTLINWKIPILFKAAENFLKKENKDFEEFIKINSFFLDDYSMFMVLSRKYNDQRWFSVWDKKYANREENALKTLRTQESTKLKIWCVLQYFFFSQWMRLKKYANDKGIQIIGDIPIFVSSDSCDTWSNPSLFNLDSEGNFSTVSGCPPDCFCPTGQLWGNPTYNWEKMKKNKYSWWIKRISEVAKTCDILRIDHFRGFESYWSIKAGSLNAVDGIWEKGPGYSLFKQIKKEIPNIKIIAEDLGFITDKVEKLLKETNYPGMRIQIFGYEKINGKFNLSNNYLPKNYPYNTVAYTGTHDNQTLVGWFNTQDEEFKNLLLKYYNTNENKIFDCILLDLFSSNAKYTIIPIQDLLKLDDKARMNTPSTCSDHNWTWRLEKDQLNQKISKFLTFLNEKSKRNF